MMNVRQFPRWPELRPGHGLVAVEDQRGVCTPVLDQLALQITIALVGAVLVA